MKLELRNISKTYSKSGFKFKYKKENRALQDISLQLDCGIYGLLGPNGAGKSTLMNIITGNIPPDSGEVLWDDQPIQTLGTAFRSLIGYAPQQQGLYDSFTGRRFLSYMAALKGIGRGQAGNFRQNRQILEAEIHRVLTSVNLCEAADKPVRTYSGGMKQRILIAQAILGNPRLLVLDEPTAGLDPKERVRVREQIRSLSENRIIIVSTHVVSDIAPIAGEVILLRKGTVADRDTVEGLCRKYGNCADLEEVYMHIFGEEEEYASLNTL